MKQFYSITLLLLLQLNTNIVHGEEFVTRSINLNYRQAEDVVSLLRPFLHEKGVISADGYRILVKTTPKNYQDLLQLVAEVDVSMRQLRVSVTVDNELVTRENGSKTSDSDNDDTPLGNSDRQYSTTNRNPAGTTQHVNVIEGKWANISSGESVPVGQRIRNPDGTVTESVTYKSINNSIQVLPRISGERVTLFIRPQISNQTGAAGRSHSQSAETTVTGSLNQWIAIGGSSTIEINQPGSRLYSTQQSPEAGKQMYVKVEVIQ